MDIVLIEEKEIDLLSQFASEVFIEYYTNLINEKQATYMANLFLSKKTIKELLNNGAIFKMVIDNNNPVGFTEYIKQDNRIFLSKLYVHKDHRHKHIGRLMLNEVIEYAKQDNIDKVYLTVNKYNYNSIDCYKHIGFKIIDAVVNDIGMGYVMDDYIMELDI